MPNTVHTLKFEEGGINAYARTEEREYPIDWTVPEIIFTTLFFIFSSGILIFIILEIGFFEIHPIGVNLWTNNSFVCSPRWRYRKNPNCGDYDYLLN